MNNDQLRAPLPADDTIALLVRAARRAGIDVESDALLEAVAGRDPLPTRWRHRQSAVAGFLAALVAPRNGHRAAWVHPAGTGPAGGPQRCVRPRRAGTAHP